MRESYLDYNIRFLIFGMHEHAGFCFTEWIARLDSKSIDRFYLGKNQLLLQQVFGRPDKTQGEWWGYANMNITSGGGEKYQEVWFGFANGVVREVRLG